MEQELKEYQEQLEFLAFHDPLTRLPNRTLFWDRASQAITDAKHNGHGIAILFLDCDRFKNVNDTYGHDIGDEVIKELGRRVSISIGESDTVAHLGGDEFTVLLPHTNTQQDVVEVATRILQSTRSSWKIGGYVFTLTVSIGAAIYPSDGMDARTLVKRADAALYDAKQKGKNTCVFYGLRSNA